MKKFRLMIMSLLMLALGGMLVACTVKSPNIEFTSKEEVMSVGQEIDLSQYLKITGRADNVELNVENSSIVSVDKKILKAKNTGKTYVYATYKKNILASLRIVVKDSFTAPTGFNVLPNGTLSEEENKLTWNVVSAFYQNDLTPTIVSQYLVKGLLRKISEVDGTLSEIVEINQVVNTNSFVPQQYGEYQVTITALGKDYFDSSVESERVDFYYGAMQQLELDDLTWNENGMFNWNAVDGASYRVTLDDAILGNKTQETSFDFSQYFDNVEPGTHTIGVIVYDNENKKLPTMSKLLTIKKIEEPLVEYIYDADEGGRIHFVATNETEKIYAKLIYNDSTERNLELNWEGREIESTLAGMPAGIFRIELYATPSEGNYYKSDINTTSWFYKLGTLALSGAGNNEVDQNVWNMVAEGTASYPTKIMANLSGQFSVVDGLDRGMTSKAIELELISVGAYVVTARQIPSLENYIYLELPLYGINSDESNELEVVKLAAIENIAHTYSGNVSTFSFDAVENATRYELFVLDGDEFVVVPTTNYNIDLSDEVLITFVEKIETLFAGYKNDEVLTFKIVAHANDETKTINSSTQKVLVELAAPERIARQTTDMTYRWTEVEFVDEYNIEIYEIDKAVYDAASTDIDTTSLTNLGGVVQTNSYTFDAEGYYLVKVFSISGSEDDYISSTACLKELVCVAKKLQVQEVKFGYDNDLSRYFVNIKNSANVDSFEIDVNGAVVVNDVSGDATSTYYLTQNFDIVAGNYPIVITAHAEDGTLYLDSDEYTLNIVKLPTIIRNDVMPIEEWNVVSNANYIITSKNQDISLNVTANARGVKIWKTTDESECAGGPTAQSARYSLANETNVSLSFKYYGFGKIGEYFNIENNVVCLDSNVSEILFERLATPTNLRYDSGNLKFENISKETTGGYVITAFCKDANANINNLLIMVNGNVVSARYGNEEATLSESMTAVTYVGNEATIRLSDLLELIKNCQNTTISNVYNQAIEYGFAVYTTPSNAVNIASQFATLQLDSNKNIVKVEKMQEPKNFTFSIGESNITFTWDEVSTITEVSAQTTYQMHVVTTAGDEEFGPEISGSTTKTCSLSEFELSKYYTFYVVAQNPYYMGSNSSNKLRIYKLDSIKTLKLISGDTYDGKLEYQVASAEQEFCDYVLVGDVHNTTGKIEIASQASVSLKVVGKKNLVAGDVVTSYIDSTITSWTLSNMSTLAPADETITFNNNTISWNQFAAGKGLSSLKYVLMFDDGENVATFTTTETSVSFVAGTEIYDTVAALNEGQLTIAVYAFLDTYSVVAGGTIYYAAQALLANGHTEANYYQYANTANINKLTTPVISNIAFDYNNDLSQAALPDIVVTFTGSNYGATGRFSIYLNDELVETTNIAGVGNNYSYTITSATYNNAIAFGADAQIKICALSTTDIPSSMGSVTVSRASKIESAAFVEEGRRFTQKLLIGINGSHTDLTSGGIVAKAIYTENGSTEQTAYFLIPVDTTAAQIEYNMADFIANNLANGGKVKFELLTNSYSNNTNHLYYLSCSEYFESAEFNVLKQVTSADITKTAGGFEIDPTLNSTTTTYVVKYGANEYEVKYKDNKFTFDFDKNWEDATYNLIVYAVENRYVESARQTIPVILNRIDSVSMVEMRRNNSADLSEVTISWDAVSDATGYIFSIYDAEEGTKIFSKEVTGVSHTLTELCGVGYEEIFTYGEIGSIRYDLDVKIGITAVGASASQNNSKEYLFNATIKGNDMSVSDFRVNEYGVVAIDVPSAGQYMYRFVNSSGGALSSSKWTLITADAEQIKIDASFLSANHVVEMGEAFNIEFFAVGNVEATSIDSNFMLDSSQFTSTGKALTFEMGTQISDISINLSEGADLVFEITNGVYTNIFFGLDEDAILNSADVAIIPLEIDGEEGSNKYRTPISRLLDVMVNTFGTTPYGEKTLYFWNYRETEPDDVGASYVNYLPYELDFKYVESCGFDEVRKFTDNTGTEFKVDYADVTAFFDKVADPYLSGNAFTFFLVKVSQEGEEVGTFVVDYDHLQSDYYPDETNSYIVNLTKLFREEELKSVYGELTINFAILQIDTFDNVRISNWMSEEIEFTRIRTLTNLSLSAGTLTWNNMSDLATKYYVYFIEDIVDGEIGDSFERYDTNQTFFLATDFVGQDRAFYIAVQAVSDAETNCLPSNFVYITDDGEPVMVTKNQIKSQLKMKDGKFYFEWDSAGDFLTAFDELSSEDSEEAAKLTTKTFSYPYTMTLADIVGDTIRMRFRFKNITTNVTKNFDVNAKDLLLSLFDVNSAYKAKVDALSRNASTAASRRIYKSFEELMEKTGTFGIANINCLFDDYFENLQAGKYSLEYCLVGGSKTLNSYWYGYKNENDENIIYVGAEPRVSAIKQKTATEAVNDYKILVKKSAIYNSSYEAETATNYVMKIYNDVGVSTIFAITNNAVSILKEGSSTTIPVYQADATGEKMPSGVAGDYLMFYINHNDGNSLLGKFGEDIEKGTYSMQIYTVGNDYTISSKSEYFKLTFYKMGENLAVTNGMFTWTTQANRNTTVVFKKHNSTTEVVRILDGSLGSSSFDLDGEGSGLYDYIEFVTVGDVSRNLIAVDSEIYRINNVYKLQNTALSNYKGLLAIRETENNLGAMEEAYSESPLYAYKIYNKESTESLLNMVTNTNQNSTYYYTPGTTGYVASDAEYNYRRTESSANEFYVSSIGSTARFGYEIVTGDPYYIRTIYGLDENDQLVHDKNILISSAYQTISAKMMDAPSGLTINDGVLTWTGVSGSGAMTLSTRASVVYRVEVTQYKISYAEGGQSKTTTQETSFFYTAKTKFDFANLNEEQLAKDVQYLDVVVRALALTTAGTRPPSVEEEDCVTLVEGGVAYGNLQYQGTSTYVLIGEGGTIDTIERSQSIDENSLCVVDGSLQWTFSVEGDIDTSDGQWNLLSHYNFSVMDVNNKEIEGTFIVSDVVTKEARVVDGENVIFTKFVITFKEEKDQIAPGTNRKLTVYAIEIDKQGQNVIKSYGQSITVSKLAPISANYIAIDSTNDPKVELFNLWKYVDSFASTYNNLKMKTLQHNDNNGYVFDGREFDANKYKLYILSADASIPVDRDPNALADVERVDQNELRLIFQVVASNSNCLYSDISDDIVLQRANLQDEIVWDDATQQFVWDYTGTYSLSEAIVANVVELDGTSYVDVLDGDAPVVESLAAGTLYNLIEDGETYAIISVSVEGENETTTTTYRIPLTAVIRPTFIVTISYGNGEARTYTTQTRYFKPTAIGTITRFAVRVKLGETNVQSNEIVYEDEFGGNEVQFNLFASGEGTLVNPYIISTKDQFSNIAYRMTKDEYLNRYMQGAAQETEEGSYYFTLNNNITLDDFDGVKFHGEFTGILDGANNVLSYTATDVGRLDSVIRFDANYLSNVDEDFNKGVSLFSTIASSAIVKNLKLNVSLNKESGYISENAAIAGLTIVNNGQINNVSLVKFSSNFVGNYSSEMVNMLYAGIATKNVGGTANILNCSVNNYTDDDINYVADIVINNGGKSQRNCISGIVTINYSTIENCIIGESNKSNVFKVVGEDSSVESKIAGVAVINVQNAQIRNCTNNALLTTEATDITNVDQWRAYFAGITCHNQGTLQGNVNTNYVVHTGSELGFTDIYQGEIYIA